MGIRVNITTDGLQGVLKQLEKLKDPIDKPTAELVGTEVVEEMKSLIASGKSPIAGNGAFPKYINPKKYPGKQKSKSPVNLFLTGKFLAALRATTKKGTTGQDTYVGFRSSNQAKKESGHREGVNGQPERPIIPIGDESFVLSIRKIIREIYEARIDFLTKKK